MESKQSPIDSLIEANQEKLFNLIINSLRASVVKGVPDRGRQAQYLIENAGSVGIDNLFTISAENIMENKFVSKSLVEEFRKRHGKSTFAKVSLDLDNFDEVKNFVLNDLKDAWIACIEELDNI